MKKYFILLSSILAILLSSAAYAGDISVIIYNDTNYTLIPMGAKNWQINNAGNLPAKTGRVVLNSTVHKGDKLTQYKITYAAQGQKDFKCTITTTVWKNYISGVIGAIFLQGDVFTQVYEAPVYCSNGAYYTRDIKKAAEVVVHIKGTSRSVKHAP